MKIAVIGSGISGLSAAYYLSKKYHVDLYEKEDHFGGHSHTVEIKNDKKSLAVDVGFIVFNELTYPNLIKFFNEINVEYEKSNMSFAVSVEDTGIEYSGSGFKGLFSNKKNLFNPGILHQVTASLAAAESLFEFEHRDLHWGNVLVCPTNEKQIRINVQGVQHVIPTHGVMASIIDFTISR